MCSIGEVINKQRLWKSETLRNLNLDIRNKLISVKGFRKIYEITAQIICSTVYIFIYIYVFIFYFIMCALGYESLIMNIDIHNQIDGIYSVQ